MNDALYEDPRGELSCPFCNGRISFPVDTSDRHVAAVHSLPECKVFIEADDALDFVKRCNLEVARQRGVHLA